MTRGLCVKIMSGDSFEVNELSKLEGKTWFEHRPTMIQMPISSWTALKKWIIKICKNNSQCDKEVASWERTVEFIDSAIEMQ